jgi:hypothetical protein
MKKGKFYYGVPGIGKSTRLRVDYDASNYPLKTFKTAREITLIGQRNGLEGIANIIYNNIEIFVDDIGHEAKPVTHFGTTLSPVSELIQAQYDAYQKDTLSMAPTRIERNIKGLHISQVICLQNRSGSVMVISFLTVWLRCANGFT